MKGNKEQDCKKTADENDEDSNDRNKIKEVIYTIKPAIVFENWFGMFRFRLVDGELHPPDTKMKILGILMPSTYIVLFSIFLRLPAAVTGTSKLLDMMEEVPSIVILIQYVTSAITASFLLSASNIRIFTTLADLDSMLHIKTSEDFYKKSRKQTIKYLLILILIFIVSTVIDTLTEDEITMSRIIVLPMYLLQRLEILAFCKMIVMLKSRLKLINSYLTIFIQEKDNNKTTVFTVSDKKAPVEKFNLIGRISPKNKKIRDLAMMYDIIGGICCLINDVFNFQIFMTLVSTFTYIVITIWTSLYYYRTPENNPGPLISIAIWCITTVLTVAVMSFACERLLIARSKTKILVTKIIMDYDLPKTMRVQAKAFMELIEAWPLRIFIYDMFSVDIMLMLKFISVATTYLIVIIQISHFI